MFFRLVKTDFKRIKYLLLPLILATGFLCVSLLALAAFADKIIYKEQQTSPIRVGVVMSVDSEYGQMAYRFVTDMQSFSDTCEFLELESEEVGVELLQKEEIKAVIIVPDNVVADIMDGTNTPITVIYNEDGSLETYVLNEIFVSTSSMLGTAQAAIYTALNISRNSDLPTELHAKISIDTNALFLDYTLSRMNLFEENTVNATGVYPVKEFYIASGFLLLLSLIGILFMSILKNNSNAYVRKLKLEGISSIHMTLSQILTISLTLYGLYLLLYFTFTFASYVLNAGFLTFHVMALFTGLPVCICIALLTVLVSKIPSGQVGASLILFILIFIFAYTGGCLVPETLLPEFMKSFCIYSPYHHLIQFLCKGMF